MKYPKGYGIVFKQVLTDPSIRIEVKALYALLAAYTGADDVCWPSVSTMAKALGCTEQSIRNWAEELKKSGWLEVETFNDGVHSNRYSLCLPKEVLNPGGPPPSTGVEDPPSTGVDPTINSLTKNNDNAAPAAEKKKKEAKKVQRPPEPKVEPDFTATPPIWTWDYEEDMQKALTEWAVMCPHIDVEQQLWDAIIYARDHPEKGYTKWFRYLDKWMHRQNGWAAERREQLNARS